MSTRVSTQLARLRLCGLGGAGIGAAATHAMLWGTHLLAWFSTDVVIGYGVMLLAAVVAVLGAASPLRTRSPRVAILHGFASGAGWWCVGFALLGADLQERHDRLFVAWMVCAVCVVVAKTVFGPFLVYTLARLSLRDEPSGHGPLACIRTMLLDSDGNCAAVLTGQAAAWRSYGKCVRAVRCALGVGRWRSYAIERAVQHALNAAAARQRRSCERRHGIASASDRLARAAAAELELESILREVEGRSPSDGERWIPRVLVAWDLLRHGARLTADNLQACEAMLLEELFYASVKVPVLAEAVRACKQLEVSTQLADHFALTEGPPLGELECLAAVLTGDVLLDVELAAWACGLVDAVEQRGAPKWAAPSLSRIRLAAESMILRHNCWIEPAGVASRRMRRGLAAVAADAPDIKASGEEHILPASLRRMPVPAARRGVGQFAGRERHGADNGPGRAMASAGLAALFACIAWAVIGSYPLGAPSKRLIDLYQVPGYSEFALSSADKCPNNRTLAIGSMGGGVHLIDTSTFRIRSERASLTGLSSDWISAVAADASGAVAARTHPGPPVGTIQESAGADVRLPSGGWKTLIAASGVPGLDPGDLSAVIAVGPDKVLVLGSRLVLYRSEVRGLVELTPASSAHSLDPAAVFTAAAGTSDGSGRFWLGAPRAEQGRSLGSLWEVQIIGQSEYAATRESHPPMEAEGVVQVAAHGGGLLVRTAAQRLYEKTAGGWRLRIDGDSGLDLSRVGHVVTVEGDRPAVWLTELDEQGGVQAIRLRVLRPETPAPDGPWYRGDLVAGVRTASGTSVKGADIQAGVDGPTPAAWYDRATDQHVMVVPSADSGLVRFCSVTTVPTCAEDATLVADTLATPGERVVWLDASDGRLVLVLEAISGDRRRVAWVSCEATTMGVPLKPQSIQLSWSPDPAFKDGVRILACRADESGQRIDAVTELGRVMSYDRVMRGWSSARGVELLDEGGRPVGRIVSAGVDADRVLVVAADGRILRASLPRDLRSVPSLAMQVVHRPSAVRPAGSDQLVRVATESDGSVMFMSPAGGGMLVQPWTLRLDTAAVESLMGWSRDVVQTGKALRTDSLTRIQTGGRVGPLLGIDEGGALLYRSAGAWAVVAGADSGWSRVLSTIGGTFIQGEAGIALVQGGGEQPTLSTPLWTRQQDVLELPVSAIAAVAGPKGSARLVVAHNGGLASYDPHDRTWTSILDSRASPGPAPEGEWELCGTEATDGTCSHLWAVRRKDGRPTDLLLIRGESASRPVDGPVTSVATAGDGIAVVRSSGELVFVEPTGTVRSLTGPLPSEKVGGPVTRACGGAGGTIWALSEAGRLLRVTGPGMTVEALMVPGVTSIRDIVFAKDGALYLLTNDHHLRRWVPGSEMSAEVKVFGQPDLLQLAGDESIAAAPSSGEFAVLNGTSAWAGAGGMSSGAKLGRVSAVLADGDWLWVGGAEGMVGRDPIQRKYLPVSGTAGVDRIERVGDSVVAWDSSGPRVVVQGDSGLTTARPSFNTSSVLTSPGENLIGVTNSHDGPLFRGLVRADPSVESLFRSEATLGNEIRAAALDENGGVLLKGADGSLLRYTLGTRSLSVMARASELPKSWDFMLASGRPCLVPSGKEGRGEVYVVERGIVRKIGKDARSILRTAEGVCWIESDGTVMELGRDGGPRVLGSVANHAARAVPSSPEQVLSEPDGTLWWLRGGLVTGYDTTTGNTEKGPEGVERLGYIQGKAVGIVATGLGGRDVVRLRDRVKLSALKCKDVMLGDASVLGWSVVGDMLSVEYMGDAPFRISRRVRPTAALTSDGVPKQWAAVDDRWVYFLTSGGGAELYDAASGEWVSAKGGPWRSLGRLGTSIVGVRSIETGAALDFFEPGDTTPRRSVAIRGEALFTGDRHVDIRTVDPGTVRIGFVAPGGEFESVSTFSRATEPFVAESSISAQLSDGALTLVGLATQPGALAERWVLISKTGEWQPIRGLPESVMRGAVSAELNGDYVLVSSESAGVAVVRADTGEVVGAVTSVGRIGTETWTVNRTAEGALRIARLHDGVVLESVLSATDAVQLRRVSQCEFRSMGGRDVLVIVRTPDGDQQPSEPIAIGVTDGVWGTSPVSSPSTGQTRVVRPLSRGLLRGIQLGNRKLDADGWFDDEFPTMFHRSEEDRRLLLTMRDGSVRTVEAGHMLSNRPPTSEGDFELRNARLVRRRSGAVLGDPWTDAPLAADRWISAMPVRKGQFYSIDASGQLWWWSEPDGAKRVLVALPDGNAAASLALPAVSGGDEVIVLDPAGNFVATVTKGAVVAERGPIDHAAGPGLREGGLGLLRWRRSSTGMEVFQRIQANDGTAEDVALRPGDGGLDTDRPVGLCRIEEAPGVWLDVGRSPSGRSIVCPANADAAGRRKSARLVTKHLEPLPDAAFSLGTMRFAPQGGTWRVDIGGVPIPVQQGRLAIDRVRLAATVREHGGLVLWLATELDGVLVRQSWAEQLGAPELVPVGAVADLRARSGVLCVKVGTEWKSRSGDTWEPVQPDWKFSEGAPSQWRFMGSTGRLAYAGETTDWLEASNGVALAADVLSMDLEADGSPRVRAAPGGVAFQSRSGKWFLARPDRTVATLLRESPAPGAAEFTNTASGARVPARSAAGGTYLLPDARGGERRLPWRLAEGQFPHNVVEAVRRWTNAGIQARLADGLGYRVFAKLDGEKVGPTVCGEEIPEAVPSVDRSLHTGAALNSSVWLRWHRNDQSFLLALESVTPGAVSGTIGPLGTRGNPLDDPDKIRPLFLRNGNIDFAFEGRVWTMAMSGGISSNSPIAGATAPTRNIALVVDAESGKLVLGDAPIPGEEYAPSVLGRFFDDGKLDRASTLRASPDARVPGSFRVHRPGAVEIDLTLEPGMDGWRAPGEYPRAAVLDPAAGLLVLGADGRTVLEWTERSANAWECSGAGPVTEGVAVALWRSNDGIALGMGPASSPQRLEQQKGRWIASTALVASASDVIDVVPGAFAFGRRRSDGSLAAVGVADSTNSVEFDPWRGLPGFKIERAFSGGREEFVWQDQHGMLRVSSGGADSWRFLWGQSSAANATRLQRVAGTLVAGLGGGENPTEFILESAGSGVRFDRFDGTVGLSQPGRWEVRQSFPGAPVSISMVSELGGHQTAMSLGPTEAVAHGALLLDRCTCLVEDPDGTVLVVSPAGSWNVRTHDSFVPHTEEARSVVDRGDLVVLRSDDGAAFVGGASEAVVVDPRSGRYRSAAGLKRFMFFGPPGDWRIWGDNTGVTFEHHVGNDQSTERDVLRGEELFSHGQFAFDHVQGVWFDPTEDGRVLVQTPRAIEALRDGARKPRLEVVATGSSRRATVLAGRNPDGRSARSAGLVSQDPLGDADVWRCPTAGGEWRLKAGDSSGKSKIMPPGQATQSFLVGDRLWVILKDGVYWIEASDRWREKRVRARVQASDSPRNEAASSASD